MLRKVRIAFPLDLRLLSALRIAVALLLLADLSSRARDLRLHYLNDGIFPLGDAWIGTAIPQAAIFVLAAFAYCLLGIGFRTRLSTILSWCAVIYLQERNPYLFAGADKLIRLTLLWGLFLPWGEFFSFDARDRQSSTPQRASWGTFAFTCQLALLYFFAGLGKHSATWRDGSAVCLVLRDEWLTTTFAPWVAAVLGNGCHALTHSVKWIEILAGLLLFIPGYRPLIRLAAVAPLLLLHLGLGSTLHLGLFPWIGSLTLAALLLPPRSQPSLVPRSARWELAAPILLLLVLWLNVGGHWRALGPPRTLQKVTGALHLGQDWHMFLASHDQIQWWELRSDNEPRLNYRGEAISTKAPIASLNPNHRWRVSMPFLKDDKILARYLATLCRPGSRKFIDAWQWHKQTATDLSQQPPVPVSKNHLVCRP